VLARDSASLHVDSDLLFRESDLLFPADASLVSVNVLLTAGSARDRRERVLITSAVDRSQLSGHRFALTAHGIFWQRVRRG
jgi:hypothetical protein